MPLAWLSGYAVGELWQAAFQAVRSAPQLTSRGRALTLAASFLGAVVVAYGGARLASDISQIRETRRIDADPLVAGLRARAPRTHWVYTRATMYAFHAQLQVIPELAVMPRKRFWSGQISQGEILAVLKRYHPEQLLLDDTELANEEMGRFLSDNYTLVSQDDGLALYVITGSPGRLGGESAPKP